MALVVGLLVALPLAGHLGWTHQLLGIGAGTRALVHGESGPDRYAALVDPGRARFGWTVALGAIVFLAVCGDRGGVRRWLVLLSIVAWAILSPLPRAALWRPLGLMGHESVPESYAALVALDLALAAVGATLLGLLTRSWRLSLVVVLSMAVVLWLGYVSRFGRGRSWMIDGLEIPVSIDAHLLAALARQAQAFWQPLIALILIELGVQERRRWIERHPGGRCPRCEYPLATGNNARCAECGWAPATGC